MFTNKIYSILVGIALFVIITLFGLYQYKCKIELKQELIQAQRSIQVQQQYIIEKDKQVKEIENKYREKLNSIPEDLCGDTIVPDKIKQWIQDESSK